ncbi:glycine receptor subunit alpha-2-like [Lingula anatina]|uniref:Glycine receptor subunit alpha-2-like n=1 Tax=Lingula anatina TaxID=7574 RepID=A0A1S3IT67_LINAN|nr:glycine receptor subunit alpha-2-like [Lingula anatina]|eukprot:XP_013401392.1 glycine receptor subunit alpha-2-like [Lingula anatina]
MPVVYELLTNVYLYRVLNSNINNPNHIDDPFVHVHSFLSGAYTCIYAEFRLKRDIRFYLLNIYAPTIVVVILSFVNFFIDPVAVPARVSIGLITVLTITTQSVSLQERLPRVSYIKAVDVWLAMCLLFVFGSVLEYAFVNVLLQKERKRRRQEAEQLIGESKRNTNTSFLGSIDSVDQVDGSVSSVDVQIENHVISTKVKHLAWDANKVDRASKYVFFVGFVVFNIGYWFLYLLLLAN